MDLKKKYPHYVKTKLAWVPEIPAGWHIRKLTHAIGYTVGFTPESGNPLYYGDDFLWANISDLGPRFLNKTSKGITQEAIAKYRKRPTHAGSLLYSFKLSVGQVSFAGKEMFTNEAIASFSESEWVHLPYFYYFAPLAIIQNASENIYGAKILNQEAIGNAKLIIPPLGEQQTIARFLDFKTAQIDSLIAKKKALLDKLAEKRTALISHAVTKGLDPSVPMKDSGVPWLGDIPSHWKALPLRRLITTVKTGTTPSGVNEFHFDDDGISWFRPGDFSDQIFLQSAEKRLSEEGIAEVRVFPAFTVMHVGIGATIGKVGVTTEQSSCNQQINAIVCNERLHHLFAVYFLQAIKEYIVKCGKYTTLPIINQDETKSLFFTVPPIDEQVRIAEYLLREERTIEEQAKKISQVIVALQEYRSALITNAVTGRIDVRDVPIGQVLEA